MKGDDERNRVWNDGHGTRTCVTANGGAMMYCSKGLSSVFNGEGLGCIDRRWLREHERWWLR